MSNNRQTNSLWDSFYRNCETVLESHLGRRDAKSPEVVEAIKGVRAGVQGIARHVLYSRGMANPEFDAENVAQDIMIRMDRIVATWRRKRLFGDAVALATRRRSIDVWRRQRRMHVGLTDGEAAAHEPPGIEFGEELWDHLGHLRRVERIVLVLRYAHDCPVAVVGRILGISDQKVVRIAYKARPKARDHLKGRDGYWDDFRPR